MFFQSLPNSSITEADILILPVPWENTVCYKPGTAYAPEAILEATDQLEYYEEDVGWSPMQYLKVCVAPKVTTTAFHTNLVKVTAALPKNNLLIALGGEHSITPTLVQGRMPQTGTVVFLDAHADLRKSYQGSEYSHACPAYRILQQGHVLVMAGIRSLFETEVDCIASTDKITMFMDRSLRKPKHWNQFLKQLGNLQGQVWLSIDMDVFNPALVAGVGTPQPGGLDWYQVVEVLEAVFFNKNIELQGMDIVELVPEASHVAEMTAAKLIQKAISFWGKAYGFDQKSLTGSQTLIDYD